MLTETLIMLRTAKDKTDNLQRRHDDLIAEHKVVDDGVVAIELPAPRLGQGRLAHHGEVVEPLAIALAEGAEQTHDAPPGDAERNAVEHGAATLELPYGLWVLRRDAAEAKPEPVTVVRGAGPQEIVEALRYFLSAKAVTGQLLCVDGGQHLAWQTPDVLGVE